MRKLTLMMIRNRWKDRGSVLVIFAAALVVIMGLAALAIDLGAIYSAQAQLQTGADSAALAAIADLDAASTVATQFAGLNSVMNEPITLAGSDVLTGQFDFNTGDFTAGATPLNAVRVSARRTSDSPDGPLPLFFARALGHNSVDLQAQSTAAIDNRVNGVNPPDGEGQPPLIPFAVKKEEVGHMEDLNGNNLDQVDFDINTETGAVVVTERVDARFQVLGSQITYGAGGQEIPVFPSVSIDGGASYTTMNKGNDVDGGENLYLTDVSDPSEIAIKARALYKKGSKTYFDSTRYSNVGDAHVVVLRQGDIAPNYAAFDEQDPLNDMIEPYLGPGRVVNIGSNDVLFLFEFNPELDVAAADFQDLVVVCTFTRVQVDGNAPCYSQTKFVANEGATVTFFPVDSTNGNWGTVSLDAINNSTAVLCYYIEDGYDKQFVIPTDPGYMYVKGDPGLSNGLEGSMQTRIGDTVLLLVYDQVSGQGSNTYYRVPYLVAVELTAMDLSGALEDRYIRGVIRSITTSNLITTPGAPLHTAMGRARMAQ